jgi:ketosteroid isomerase-like protein
MMELPAIVSAYLDAYNRLDVDSMLDCISEDVIFENVSNSGPSLHIEGRKDFAELARQAANAFHSRRQGVRNFISTGDRVALEIDWEGTPKIDMGTFKAGVQMHMRGASFLTIIDDKLTHIIDLS